MEVFILFCMVFMHVLSDYNMQGILAQMKQKAWWIKNCPSPEDNPEMYANDYKIALAMHAFAWSFAVMIPLAAHLLVTGTGITGVFFFMLVMNTMIHYVIDDMKANWGTINLRTDQTAHMLQIASTWMICLY